MSPGRSRAPRLGPQWQLRAHVGQTVPKCRTNSRLLAFRIRFSFEGAVGGTRSFENILGALAPKDHTTVMDLGTR